MIPRFLFGEDHEIFRSMVRRFIASEIMPRHADWERAGIVLGFPRCEGRRYGDPRLDCFELIARRPAVGASARGRLGRG